jgi:hypothetical protein
MTKRAVSFQDMAKYGYCNFSRFANPAFAMQATPNNSFGPERKAANVSQNILLPGQIQASLCDEAGTT